MSTVQRHPVADLLTDEMKARVRAATWVKYGTSPVDPNAWSVRTIVPGNRPCCPLGMAVGLGYSADLRDLFKSFGVEIQSANGGKPLDLSIGQKERAAVRDFVDLADTGRIDPADIYVLLGCEEPS